MFFCEYSGGDQTAHVLCLDVLCLEVLFYTIYVPFGYVLIFIITKFIGIKLRILICLDLSGDSPSCWTY